MVALAQAGRDGARESEAMKLREFCFSCGSEVAAGCERCRVCGSTGLFVAATTDPFEAARERERARLYAELDRLNGMTRDERARLCATLEREIAELSEKVAPELAAAVERISKLSPYEQLWGRSDTKEVGA